MQERTYAYLISEDSGKHWRQVGIVGEEAAAKIIADQLAKGNDRQTGPFRYKFVDMDGEGSDE